MTEQGIDRELSRCPFCDGEGESCKEEKKCGYGEYEQWLDFQVVRCKKCDAHGEKFLQKSFREFTTHTVIDFRRDPLLREKVEVEYEAYEMQTKALAVAAWNRRAEGQVAQDEIASLRATVKRLNRRTQDAEAALGEFRRIMERPPDEQGIRFVSGSIGRALLAWAWAKNQEEIAKLKKDASHES